MMSIIISQAWYKDIMDRVQMENPYFFNEHGWDKVEVDVNEEEFNRVSMELGWI